MYQRLGACTSLLGDYYTANQGVVYAYNVRLDQGVVHYGILRLPGLDRSPLALTTHSALLVMYKDKYVVMTLSNTHTLHSVPRSRRQGTAWAFTVTWCLLRVHKHRTKATRSVQRRTGSARSNWCVWDNLIPPLALDPLNYTEYANLENDAKHSYFFIIILVINCYAHKECNASTPPVLAGCTSMDMTYCLIWLCRVWVCETGNRMT